jgi:hypothetical protein
MNDVYDASIARMVEIPIGLLSTIFNLIIVYFVIFKSPKELNEYRMFLLQITVKRPIHRFINILDIRSVWWNMSQIISYLTHFSKQNTLYFIK